MLSPDDYFTAGSLTQFVSIDLVVQHQGKTLMGLRQNKPAKDTWFVPGGKTYKGQTLLQNFATITEKEFNHRLEWREPLIASPTPVPYSCHFLGVFEHQYDDNFRDNSYGTHYVVITMLVDIKDADLAARLAQGAQDVDQHRLSLWMSRERILSDPLVHKYNKYYFSPGAPNCLFRTRVL